MGLTVKKANAHSMIGQVALELTRLPEEDLPLIIEFVDYLKQQHRTAPQRRLSVAEMRAEARRRASLLRKVPRTEIVARFRELAEGIRQEAIAQGRRVSRDQDHESSAFSVGYTRG